MIDFTPWLTQWLTSHRGWLTDWLHIVTDSLTDFTPLLTQWTDFTPWLAHWLTQWLTSHRDWLTDWLHTVTDSLTDSLTDCAQSQPLFTTWTPHSQELVTLHKRPFAPWEWSINSALTLSLPRNLHGYIFLNLLYSWQYIENRTVGPYKLNCIHHYSPNIKQIKSPLLHCWSSFLSRMVLRKG